MAHSVWFKRAHNEGKRCVKQGFLALLQVIGFTVYPAVKNSADSIGKSFFKKNKSLINSQYTNSRQVWNDMKILIYYYDCTVVVNLNAFMCDRWAKGVNWSKVATWYYQQHSNPVKRLPLPSGFTPTSHLNCGIKLFMGFVVILYFMILPQVLVLAYFKYLLSRSCRYDYRRGEGVGLQRTN